MIIVIAPEQDVPQETETLNTLFHSGLECFHLRKPLKNYQEHVSYLNQIETKYHHKIVVHHHHKLVNTFSLKGIHFTEQKRIDHINNPGPYLKNLNLFGKTISASFHNPEVLANCSFQLDYHLLSPIFDSISKKDYSGKGFDVTAIDKSIIALGGITVNTIPQALSLGFKGVAVLGSIWNTKNPIDQFIALKKAVLNKII